MRPYDAMNGSTQLKTTSPNKMTLILLFNIIVSLFIGTSVFSNDQEFIGDESDGSRAIPVHKIPLLGEDGLEILPEDELTVPFSIQQTCALKCHQYERITGGWHFNAAQADAPIGRAGQPWIWFDARSATQIPLSYRSWAGTYQPSDIGLSDWEFTLRFGRHLPGSGPGEMPGKNDPKTVMRIMVSGKLEANCLACHDADPAHDQAEYAIQVQKQNFRWAAASTSAFASVTGSAKDMEDTYDYLMPEAPDDSKLIPPKIQYRKTAFDDKNRIFLDITRQAPNQRCYFCHTSMDTQLGVESKWISDEDVHLAAGMNCVDCHRNDIDHQILRGYEGESKSSSNLLADVLTCKGCHLGSSNIDTVSQGRMSAPVPEHRGIPPVHFEKLTCTACHSGPWPEDQTHRFKTSLAHGLGLHNTVKSATAMPDIYAPIYARNADNAIAPHYGIWPSFWGRIQDGDVSPLPLPFVQQFFTEHPLSAESSPVLAWPKYTENDIQQCLALLASDESVEGEPIYQAGGAQYRLDESGKLVKENLDTKALFLWPMGHNVRPAAQSLGVRGCGDCHSQDAPFFLGQVAVSPAPTDAEEKSLTMIQFQNLDAIYMAALSGTFLLRPWFKVSMIVFAFLLSSLLAVYLSRGIDRLLNLFLKKKQ